NSSDCLQIITISDRTKPVIACPPDTFVYFGESTDPDSTGTASADDNCDNSPTISYVDLFSDNIITRTWIAADACGNNVQCNQEIEIIKNSGPVWYVAKDGDNNNDGSLEYPFATFREAIENAISGDTIYVLEGTYAGEGNRDLDPAGKNIVFISDGGPEVTIINCGGTRISPHRGFYFHNGEDSTTKIIGFTISNGFANNEGGGIRCENSSPSISNSIFLYNGSSKGGGGISCLDSSSVTLTNCTFNNNNATQYGGGIYCASSSPDISNCYFTDNTTNEFGGAILLSSSTPS
ncbi:MAG: DUF1565 domain-containing protein, partial [candidate division Zixibacteria bacterium]|nr:DUF1565 domain-containing protein [candidate division Zixibacteria bacterium]